MLPGTEFSPYVGLEPYDDSHHEYFFGRQAERRLIAANTRSSALTILHGQSGAGKTSVLRAGVARDLRAVRRIAVVVFGKWQSSSCLEDLKSECEKAASIESQGEAAAFDPALPLDDLLVSLSNRYTRSFVIILDQFEEYLFYHPPDSGSAFDPELARAVNREDVPANFMLALRSDSLSRLDRFRIRIPHLMANTLELKPLTAHAGREAICKPLDVYNLNHPSPDGPITIDDRIVGELLSQLRVGDVRIGTPAGPERDMYQQEEFLEAPFLQLVLVRLWNEEMAAKSRRLRVETLRKLGGPRQIVKVHLDSVMSALSAQDRSAAARMFFFLVTPSGSKIALRSSDLAKYAGRTEVETESTLKKLTDVRILCSISQTERYEILHDVLAPAVLDWRARYQARRQLTKRVLIAISCLLAAVLMLYAGYYTLYQRYDAESRRLALEALNVQGSDPELAVILAMYSVEKRPSEESLGTLHRVLQGLQTREVIHSRHGAVLRTAASLNGKWLAWTGEDGTVTLRDIQSETDTGLGGHTGPVRALAFNRESNLIVTAGQDGFVLIREPGKSQPLQRIAAHDDVINDVVFGPGNLVATASADATAKIWKVGADKPLFTLSLVDPEVLSVAFRPDGRLIATGDSSGRLVTWDASGHRISAKDYDLGAIAGVSFSPDGQRLAVAGAGNVAKVVDVTSGSVLMQLRGHQSAISRIVFSPSGRQIGTAGADRTARLWDSDSGNELTVLRGHASGVTGLTFLGRDSRLATSGRDQTTRVWDNPPNTERLTLAGHRGPVYKVAVDPRGAYWATASADRTARIWDASTGLLLRTLEGHTGEVASVAFNHDASEVVTGSRDHSVMLWSLKDGKGRSVRGRHADAVVDVAYSPDGMKVASASWDGTAKVWDARTGELLATLNCDGDHLSSLVFGPDGSTLFTAGSDTQIRAWRVADRSVQVKLIGHQAAIYGLTMSADGKWIGSSDANGVLKIWDRSNGQIVATLPSGTDPVYSLSFTADGRFVASGSRNGSVSEWDWRVASGREHLGFLGHNGPVYSVVYSPEGRWLASAGADQTARIYALSQDDLLALARSKIVSRTLTAQECLKYLHSASCPASP